MENGEHPVQRVPAPWTLKAESYLLVLKLGGLPKGVYDELEAAWEDEALGRFEGGVGAVMVVRYTDTPVGRLSLPGLISLLVVRVFAWMSVIELSQPRNRDYHHVQKSDQVCVSMFKSPSRSPHPWILITKVAL